MNTTFSVKNSNVDFAWNNRIASHYYSKSITFLSKPDTILSIDVLVTESSMYVVINTKSSACSENSISKDYVWVNKILLSNALDL